MSKRIRQFLAATLMSGLAGLAAAAPTPVDVFQAPSVPGTGGSAMLPGPCYCDQLVVFSPVLLLQPGTYDLGTVREYWTVSGDSPFGGDEQSTLWLLFQPVATTGSWPSSPGLPDYLFPAGLVSCDKSDAACNASHAGAYEDFSLLVTVAPGENAAQVSLVGDFQYVPSVPEPSTAAMLLACLAGLVPMTRASRRRA